ncbi:MAG: dienelactone hydrolase family protein [Polyangiales bacterium]
MKFRFGGVLTLLALAACAPKPAAPAASTAGGDHDAHDDGIATSGLTYRTESTELSGFLAYPEGGTEKRPGVLVVHEWWGLNDYARARARQLAGLGYVALAVDMYGGGRNSDHPDDAKKLMTEVMSNRDEAARRFTAARDALAKDPHVDPSKIAAIGYCFGGATVLQAARRGEDLDAVASFHGNYATDKPLQKGTFAGKVFVAHGAADSFSPPEQVAGVQRELREAGIDFVFESYPNAKHGFTNPHADDTARRTGLDVGYDAAADAQSWQKLQELLRAAFAAP